ncbi:MAG: GNAT family N-acetyltransferase [Oscillospiraceae bacterium]|jgi:GNAT superfamily N-acetyltransferase|nr:GNAT family N-acetyltransferase [Oscillospiraceae bacterium]
MKENEKTERNLLVLRQTILREEEEFPKLLANYEERDWGILFYNVDEPESNDSNHAVIYPTKIADIETVLCEIKAFYLGKGLIPRVYQPFVQGCFTERKAILNKSGFNVRAFSNEFFLLSDENSIRIEPRLDVRRITEWDERVASDVYVPANEAYGVEPEKRSIKNKNYYLFAGFIADEMAAVVSFHSSELGCTRFDYILTSPKYRAKGYGKELLGFAVDYCKENHFPNCFTWFANPRSAKNGYEAGFRSLFTVETGEAVFENG